MQRAEPRDIAPERRTPPVRWYTHGWNRDLSWRLIHAIVPKIPRVLRPPIHVATTTLCYLAMPRERHAVRRNLARVTGRPGLPARLLAFRLFYNFSKVMVGYTDLVRMRPEAMRRFIEGGDDPRRRIETLLAEGKGLIVLTLHLGNWEMGLAHLAGMGRAWLRLRGIAFDPSKPSDASQPEIARADICWSASIGLSIIDPIRGADFQTRSLLLALRAGEPYRVARAYCLEA